VENIEVPLGSDQRLCPECNVSLVTTTQTATVEDTPAVPTRVIKRFKVEVGRCPLCGRTIRGQHPDLSQYQNGANAHQVGPNVKSQALALHYHSGLPLCKVLHVIGQSTEISITQSALNQMACALAEERGLLSPIDEDLKELVATSPVVNTDDTRLANQCHPEIEPTNNRAERGLRPAVIARKVSHCSKNEGGARTYSVMKSIFVILSYRTKSVIKAFACLLKGDTLIEACER
jgi:Transposase IS66 family